MSRLSEHPVQGGLKVDIHFTFFFHLFNIVISSFSFIDVLGHLDFSALITETLLFLMYLLYDNLSAVLMEPYQRILSTLCPTARWFESSNITLESTFFVLEWIYLSLFTLLIKKIKITSTYKQLNNCIPTELSESLNTLYNIIFSFRCIDMSSYSLE